MMKLVGWPGSLDNPKPRSCGKESVGKHNGLRGRRKMMEKFGLIVGDGERRVRDEQGKVV
jgi:hypothetical protein